jgi:hypothetical protein
MSSKYHLHEIDNNSLIKGLVEPRGTEQVPRVDHQVTETEPQEGGGGDVAVWARNGLAGRRRGNACAWRRADSTTAATGSSPS